MSSNRRSQDWGGARPKTRMPGYTAPIRGYCFICNNIKDDIVKLSCCKNKICKECDKRCGKNCPFCRSKQRSWIEPEYNLPQGSIISGHPAAKNCVLCEDNRDVIVKLSCCENLTCRKCDDRCSTCPFCGKTQRFWIGDMPSGSMTVLRSEDIQLSEVDGKGCYQITYDIYDNQGNVIVFDAYIPYTAAGLNTLLLLILAFYRQLTFSYNPRKTLAKYVKWSDIPHKTSLLAGNRFGYPDSGHLEHLTSILAYYRISHDSLGEEDRRQLEIWRNQLVNEGFLQISSVGSHSLTS